MRDESPCIIYTPSKSTFTQKLKGKRINDAIENISVFLEKCTDINSDNVSSCIFVAHSPYNSDDDPKIAAEFYNEITKLFGAGVTSPMSYNYFDGKPSENTRTEWELEISDFQKALNYLNSKYPVPKYTFSAVELIISYSFNLIDPDTKRILPNQASESSLMIWLSRSFSCNPTIFFPFESPNQEFINYLNKFKLFTPFELRDNYLRTVKSNKSKSGFIYKKFNLNK
jgi:hypothetical protein